MHNPAADVLSAAVVELRKAAGMSQRDLAEKLGRENSFVSRIETGQRRLDLIDWINICRVCGVKPASTIADLVDRVTLLVPARRNRKH